MQNAFFFFFFSVRPRNSVYPDLYYVPACMESKAFITRCDIAQTGNHYADERERESKALLFRVNERTAVFLSMLSLRARPSSATEGGKCTTYAATALHYEKCTDNKNAFLFYSVGPFFVCNQPRKTFFEVDSFPHHLVFFLFFPPLHCGIQSILISWSRHKFCLR